ncbi:MAG: choice-of-anchor L domain-containing protein, partial [Saprospiraceae bacterium]|nr:choice-of-anchor L domain-containing protein [Saprospiraceae bacterium]
MTQPMLHTKVFLILFCSLSFFSISAQNNLSLKVQASRTRIATDALPGANNLTLTGLEPGKTYVIKALKATAGQNAGFELNPHATTQTSAQNISNLPGKPHGIQFTALAPDVTLNLSATSTQRVTSIPLYVSVVCADCQEPTQSGSQEGPDWLANLQVVPNISAQSLINNTLIGGDCFTANNITSSGNAQARGTFTNGSTNIGMSSGMVLSTGRINILPGPNSNEAANGGFGNEGFDPQLANLVDGDLYDINIIEFDFIPTANTVQFDFVFGSEEYCEYVGTEFNDAFGFFISGPGINGVQNLAVVPNTGGVPVTTNNVNHLNNSFYYINNSQNFFECLFSPTNNTYLQECQLDGWTKPLTALVSVQPCQQYHIKLAIADLEDELYDSAVFLRANSFNAGAQVVAAPAYPAGQQSAAEGCSGGAIRFERGNGDMSQQVTVNYTISPASTATPGVDYAPLPATITIPAGQSEVLLPITVFSDALTEGLENIILLISNSCQCQQTELEFVIRDNETFSVYAFQDTTICENFSASLTAVVSGGQAPFTFEWSAGASTESILVTPLSTTTYTVTVTDGCGSTATDDVLVSVIPIVRETTSLTLCPGESVEVNGVFYSSDTTVMDTVYTGYFFCGLISTYHLDVLDPVFGAETISFCSGESVTIAGIDYFESGTVVDTLTTVNGCDSVVTYTLIRLPVYFEEVVVNLCPGETFTLNGTTFTAPGFVADTLVSSLGCDSILVYRLELLPQPSRSETISFCPGESVTLGGTTYTNSTTVTLTLPATQGCDTIATYHLQLLTQPTRSETISFCPGESVTLGGTVYTQPGVVVLTAPAQTGCDTIVTYTLQYLTPAPSNVKLSCPSAVTIGVAGGASGANVTYDDPTAITDCVCPGIDVEMTSGLPSGSDFPMGVTQVCYRAQDACGQEKTCCFSVTVAEDTPCDVKVIGCMKYELLTITQDQKKNKTY